MGGSFTPLSVHAGNIMQPYNTHTKKGWECKDNKGTWTCHLITRNTGPLFNAEPLPNPEKTSSGQIKNTCNQHHRTKEQLSALQESLDWLSLNKLPDSFKKTQQTYLCRGDYIEPNWPGREFQGNSNRAPVNAKADTYDYDDKKLSTLTGHVQITQGNRLVQGDIAQMDKSKDLVTVKSHVIIRQPNMLIAGENAQLNTDTHDLKIDKVRYVLHKQHIRGTAEHTERLGNGKINMKNATYTSAPPGSNAWYLKAGKVQLDPDSGRGVARNALLAFYDLPVFYTPYINFPIDDRRQTGLLYPTISLSGDNGFDYTQPLYLNLAPNYDNILTPRIMGERGFMLSNLTRYLQPHSTGEIGGSYLFNKDPVKEKNPYHDQYRWLLSWKHQQELTADWKFNIDYAKASDKNYLEDFNSQWQLASSNPLNQMISTHYYGQQDSTHPWELSAKFQQYQNMSLDRNDPYYRLPELNFQGLWKLSPVLTANYLASYTNFERAKKWRFSHTETISTRDEIYKYIYSDGTGMNDANGQRLYTEGDINYKINRPYGFFTSSVKLRSIIYDLNNLSLLEVQNQLNDRSISNSAIHHPSTYAPTLCTGAGLTFDRSFSSGKGNYVQTLEPRVQYVYTPYRKDQDLNPVFDTMEPLFSYDSLWGVDRFYGYDRLGDTNHIAFGVETRTLDGQGMENFRFGIGQIVYLKKREVILNPTLVETNDTSNQPQALRRLQDNYKSPVSPLTSQLVWKINEKWSMQQDFIYNTRYSYTDQYHLGINWHSTNHSIFNLGYRYLSQNDRAVYNHDGSVRPGLFDNGDIDTVETSFVLPVTYKWQAMGLWTYDITNSRHLERLAGLQTDTCSYRIRLVYRSYVNPTDHVEVATLKKGIFLQFVIKELGSMSSSQVDTYLKSINGYQPGDK